ncbi:hypothetical protein CBL_04584 [Carabus blaptoides fortunei]
MYAVLRFKEVDTEGIAIVVVVVSSVASSECFSFATRTQDIKLNIRVPSAAHLLVSQEDRVHPVLTYSPLSLFLSFEPFHYAGPSTGHHPPTLAKCSVPRTSLPQ